MLFYHYHFSIYIIGLFYGIFFDIFLMNSIGSHLVSLLILIFLYVFLKKYLFLLSSLQISITIFITLNTVIYFEIFYAFVFNNFYLNILQLLNYFIIHIELIIQIPTKYLLQKIHILNSKLGKMYITSLIK